MRIISFIILSLIPVALMESTVDTEDADRIKRSGFGPIGGVLQNLQRSAFSASAGLSSGSASAVAGLSSSSSGSSSGGHGGETNVHTHSYGGGDFDEHHDTKQFDGASLKKSILNTLLQAVKAIAGGVTTLKGQLIKSSGYLVTQKGKLIQSSGDSVSNAGKNIIANAHLVKPDHGFGGGSSIGHSLGGSFGGLTKTISSLSAGSSSSVSSASGASSGSSSSSHSSSSSGSAGGHAVAGHDVHGEYAAVEDHGYGYPNSFDNYDTKPVAHESYGPPKSSIQYIEPHQTYGTPDFNDFGGSQDVLGEILKNIPHKPTKSAISGHNFNQIPLPKRPPPFKPLQEFPPIQQQHSQYGVPHAEYGTPLVYSPEFLTALSSQKQSVLVDPKAYGAYHAMKTRKVNLQTNSFPSSSSSLPGLEHLGAPFEIQKSIQYEIKA